MEEQASSFPQHAAFEIFTRLLGVTPIHPIYGNTQGLKPSQLKQLERLYRLRLPAARLTTPEFAQRLAALAQDINLPLCAFVDRRGHVIRVGLGTPDRAKIPPLELPRYGSGRLCGLRCVYLSPKGEPPSDADLTAMVRQRLDALVTLLPGDRGYVERGYLAYLLPAAPESKHQPWYLSPLQPLEAIAAQDAVDLVASLESELRREFGGIQVEDGADRAVLVGFFDRDADALQTPEENMQELAQLVESAGGIVLDSLWQRRDRPHPQTVLGEGKILEIAALAQTLGATLVVFNRELTPAQTRNLERIVGLRVCDRTEIVLDIFAQRARTAEGKLQVELAQLEYRLPRLAGRGQALSRLGGGIGTRGPGETKLETDRRIIQKRIARLQQQVNGLQAHRARLRQRRQDRSMPTLAIVGYTNAGKSTLFNAIAKADAYAADRLFATLDPTTRRIQLPNGRALLLTDTVGFIHELPQQLVDAFRATLEEVTEADALLHVVDVSHASWESHVRAVRHILDGMAVAVGPTLLVLNKLDLAAGIDLQDIQRRYPNAIAVSATTRQGFDRLLDRIAELLQYAVGNEGQAATASAFCEN